MTPSRRDVVAGVAATVLAQPAKATANPTQVPFLWGVATAAHQIEGNNTNSDYWVLEHLPDSYFKEPSGDACDSLNRWREDVALVKAAGLNAYRFSVEWARIEPEPGRFSPAMLGHYRTICVHCRDQGIVPIVTFHHFTSPRWIAAMGGWENPEVADRFARYAEVVARALGDVIGWACTLNEPNAQVTSKVMALGKPWDKEPGLRAEAARRVGSDRFHAYFLGDSYKVRDVCLLAHRKGRDAIKAAAPHVKVGITLALQELSAGPGGEALYKKLFAEARAPFYAAAKGDDFIGVQTYNRMLTGPAGYLATPPGSERDMWNRDAEPSALAAVIAEAHRESGVDVLVSEHGINTADDSQRVRHLRASVEGMARAIGQGLPVLGYIHWSLLDNFEWSSGYVPRFGLVAVDRATFRRTPKPSHESYHRLVRDMRAKHRWA